MPVNRWMSETLGRELRDLCQSSAMNEMAGVLQTVLVYGQSRKRSHPTAEILCIVGGDGMVVEASSLKPCVTSLDLTTSRLRTRKVGC